MSRAIWKQTLVARSGEGPAPVTWEAHGFHVPRVVRFDRDDEQFAPIPDPRSYSLLNRKAVLLAAVGMPSAAVLAPLIAEDSFSVGIYCAAEKGPADYDIGRCMMGRPREELAVIYKANRSPKRFFKEIANIPVSYLGIILGITGPHLAFTHSLWASLHALQQAELDLETGVVKAALVCSSYAVEDPVATMRLQRQLPPTCALVEGAAAIVLVADGAVTDWYSMCSPSEKYSFGTANDLVTIALELNINDETRNLN